MRELREARTYTLEALAEKIGLDAPRLSRMERGERSIDTLVLRRLSSALEVRMDDFFLEPEPQVMARGTGSDEMVDWARQLRRDLDFVAEFRRGGSA
jgi:transcriptional regulator with XRE-family HTH domain